MSSSSRSPSNFFRSNRRSVTDFTAPLFHRRGNSDALLPTVQAPDVPVESSRSTAPSSGMPVIVRGMERLEQRRTVEERNFLQTKTRSPNLNPPVDLRLLDYVSPCDENLTCPICRCPFVDPVVLNECDHCFCRDCIRQTWTTTTAYNPLGPRGDCPTCRTPAKLGARSATSKILINILDDLIVKCPKSDEGCKSKLKRGEVQDHVSIYCGWAMVECPVEGCELPVRRKDAKQGCLHYSLSCLACHEEMQKCHLETHCRSKCPDRSIFCDQCNADVYYRDIAEHTRKLCPAANIKCPGESLGCTIRSKKSQLDMHTKSCTFALLAPVIMTQQQRLDEQEAAQKEMSRKLQVLEDGFGRMQTILFPETDDPDQTSADPSSIPLLDGHGVDAADDADDFTRNILHQAAGLEEVEPASLDTSGRGSPSRPSGPAPAAPGPRPVDLPESYGAEFDLDSPFPPPAANGPYASPLHHLLSMHENLRDEMSRVNTALQELDGRHSMQIVNENMRTREEINYIGAQVAGLSRQVHWLTSSQLQRQSRSATPSAATAAGEIAAAGPSVEAAISSAVRGAARIVNAGREGVAMRRGPSEEGRTKL